MTSAYSTDAVISKPPALYADATAQSGAVLPPGEESTLSEASAQSHSTAWSEQAFIVPPPPDLQPVVEDIAR